MRLKQTSITVFCRPMIQDVLSLILSKLGSSSSKECTLLVCHVLFLHLQSSLAPGHVLTLKTQSKEKREETSVAVGVECARVCFMGHREGQ